MHDGAAHDTVIDDSIDRRTLLRWFGIGAAATALAACSSGSKGGTGSSTTQPASSLPASSVSPGSVPWNTLQSKLTGHLVRPGNQSYLTDLQLYDPRFDGVRPAAIAYCANPADVQQCVGFARANGVPLTARSGGHSYAGYSTNTGLVIDVSAMNAVAVSGGNATVGAGARLIDLYTSLNSQGVSIPGARARRSASRAWLSVVVSVSWHAALAVGRRVSRSGVDGVDRRRARRTVVELHLGSTIERVCAAPAGRRHLGRFRLRPLVVSRSAGECGRLGAE